MLFCERDRNSFTVSGVRGGAPPVKSGPLGFGLVMEPTDLLPNTLQIKLVQIAADTGSDHPCSARLTNTSAEVYTTVFLNLKNVPLYVFLQHVKCCVLNLVGLHMCSK
jgi:hypothetical protein